jgi:predicted acyl esterase
MIFEKNTPIPISDGNILRCNIFRPEGNGQYPVIMAMGAYGKDIHFEDGYNAQWNVLKKIYPEIDQAGSSGRFLRWEVIDPERWVPDGFVVIQIDSRGTGMSPGYIDPFGPVETHDYYEAIEWAAMQSWSTGKVGLIGVSYLAMKQWQVAALKPPHLAAIVPWEGASDFYRDSGRHGGIFSNSFTYAWWPRQVLSNQYGSGSSHHIDRDTGQRTTGPALQEELLVGNRTDHPHDRLNHPLDDAWNKERSPLLEQIEVPLLSAANWGGAGMHLRGNIEGFVNAASSNKWLFAHIGTHYESFYLPQYVAIQKRFFHYFLKGVDNGWGQEPKVQLAIRNVDGTASIRKEHEWPLARTQWQPFFLNALNSSLSSELITTSESTEFESNKNSVNFSTSVFSEETEFTGPVLLKLWISSSETDIDLFAILRVFDPSNTEVTFIGAHEKVPLAQGWLRASHRKLDVKKSLPYRPYHSHDERQALIPHEIYPVEIEIWPTSIVFPIGYKLVLTIQGNDFVVNEPGRLLHNHPQDRDDRLSKAQCKIYTGSAYPSQLILPMIPR